MMTSPVMTKRLGRDGLPINHLRLLLVMMMLSGVIAQPLQAREYFVSLQGSDDHTGQTADQAFATIQKGVDALAPGDTLTIAPGEYFEHVYRENLGGDDAVTTIRAALPRTVTLRGDKPIAGFKPTTGQRFTYETTCPQMPQGVFETSTPRTLRQAAALDELPYKPGSWYYDDQAKKLYISTTDLRNASEHQYSISLTPEHGLYLKNPTRVVVQGLVARGFYNREMVSHDPGYFTVWGIIMRTPKESVIRNCVAYLNGGGIGMRSSDERKDHGQNVIERCMAFANDTPHGVEVGNIIHFSSKNNIIRDCYVYLSRGNGLRHYGAGISGPAIVQRTIGWGNGSTDMFLKGGKISEYGMVENSVTLGKLYSKNLKHAIVGTYNQYNRDFPNDSFSLQRMSPDQRDVHFADWRNLDFHLQATSSLRSAAHDGSDRGPYPYTPDIFYISRDGDDAADGLSMEKAWRTLDHAIAHLKPGQTLYIQPGVHQLTRPVALQGSKGKPIAIRGRGIEPVVINTPVTIQGCRHLQFERLHFTQPVTMEKSDDVSLRNVGLYASGDVALTLRNARNITLTHNIFTGFARAAIDAKNSQGLFLAGNLFDNALRVAVRVDHPQAVRYSDYNTFTSVPHENDRGHERDSSVVQPAWETQQVGDISLPVLANPWAFAAQGPHGHAAGFQLAFRPRDLPISPPVVHSMTATTANIEWQSAVEHEITVAWGLTPDCKNTAAIKTFPFGAYSLTGLQPGTTYYFRLVKAEAVEDADKQLMSPVTFHDQPLQFTTPSQAHEPVVYYVAPDGDDSHSGLSREQAWRTVAKAGREVLAGDTVLIAGGTYSELVHIRGSGEKDLPITFMAMPGEKVVFDGLNRTMNIAFMAPRKHHIHIDGLYFKDYGYTGWETVLSFFDSTGVTITRCFFNHRGRGGNPPLSVYMMRCRDIVIRNCVMANGTFGMCITSPRNLLVEHNVFLHNLITVFNISSPSEPGTVVFQNNIVIDSHVNKVKVHMFEIGGFEQYVFRDNAFFFRVPDEQRKPFLFYGKGPGRLSVGNYEARSGYSGNVMMDPKLAMSVGVEPLNWKKQRIFLGDWMANRSLAQVDFPDYFTTDASLMQRGIGLQPGAFESFHFNHHDGHADASANHSTTNRNR